MNQNIKYFSITIIAFMLFANGAFADLTFDNESDFLNALNTSPSFESFESLAATDSWILTNNVFASDFSISTDPRDGLSIMSASHSGIHATDGSQYIGWSSSSEYLDVALNFNYSIFAFGVTLTDALDQGYEDSISLTVTSQLIETGSFPGNRDHQFNNVISSSLLSQHFSL